jgi:glutathione S-transferase
MGDKFTVADAYLFTVLRWTGRIEIDLGKWPTSRAMWIASQHAPKIAAAMKTEG